MARVDGIAVIKKGDDCCFNMLYRIFSVCMAHDKVPEVRQNAYIVPLYKGKGDSLSYVLCKLYGSAVIERVVKCTEHLNFNAGRECRSGFSFEDCARNS